MHTILFKNLPSNRASYKLYKLYNVIALQRAYCSLVYDLDGVRCGIPLCCMQLHHYKIQINLQGQLVHT